MGEDMFKDLALSRERMVDFHSKLEEGDTGRRFSAMVLQRSAWPFSTSKFKVDYPLDVRVLSVQVFNGG
jgi:cullin-4